MTLATVRKVDAIYPIEGADQIELVQVGGWTCIVKKGKFKTGDLGIYFQIDSFLPEIEQFEFLRKRCFKTIEIDGKPTGGFRIKTMKMKGVLSQGLMLPFGDFSTELGRSVNTEIVNSGGTFLLEFDIDEGTDVTNCLGVKKFEKPIPVNLRAKVAGNFPRLLRKTDQERVQNLTREVFGEGSEYREGTTYEVSLKLDGSSITIYGYNDPETQEYRVGVCSRNLELKLEDAENPYIKTVLESGLVQWLQGLKVNIAFQGELVGPGIQKNFENFDDYKVYIFDVFDIDDQRYLLPYERRAIYETVEPFLNYNRMDHIPVLKKFEALQNLGDLENALVIVEGPSVNQPVREGLVFKSNVAYKHRSNSPFTFKIVSNKYLLECEE